MVLRVFFLLSTPKGENTFQISVWLTESGHTQPHLIMRNQCYKANTFSHSPEKLRIHYIQTSSRVSSDLVSLGLSSLSFTFFTCSDTLLILSVPLKRCKENDLVFIRFILAKNKTFTVSILINKLYISNYLTK